MFTLMVKSVSNEKAFTLLVKTDKMYFVIKPSMIHRKSDLDTHTERIFRADFEFDVRLIDLLSM